MIKHIVFDVGNVLLKWQPSHVVRKLFPEQNTMELTQTLFKSPVWYDLNLGKISEAEALGIYHETHSIDYEKLNFLLQEIKNSLLPVDNSLDLLSKLYESDYALYALTDNVREIMSYLKGKYTFWDKFKGIVVSAEVGYLKPAPEIYSHLLSTYDINPVEAVFIDDHLPNVDGARLVGMQGIQFINANQCIDELSQLGVNINCEV